jgi:hypothetical protein
VRGRPRDALRAILWPAAATGFVIIFVEVGLPDWAAVLLAFAAAGVTKNVLSALFLPRYRWLRLEEWGIPGMDDVIDGRWTEKEEQ